MDGNDQKNYFISQEAITMLNTFSERIEGIPGKPLKTRQTMIIIQSSGRVQFQDRDC
jgi:hypothetical protein